MEKIVKKVIKIYYEGDTEKLYINKMYEYFKLKQKLHKKDYDIMDMIKIKGGICKKTIEKAKNDIKNEICDIVYIIIDKEEDISRIKILDETDSYLKNQKQEYKENIKLIISNPTFEIWLLFHFKNTNNKKFTQKEIINLLPNIYSKNNERWIEQNIFDCLGKIDTAIKNAKNNSKESCSNFYELIEYIIE